MDAGAAGIRAPKGRVTPTGVPIGTRSIQRVASSPLLPAVLPATVPLDHAHWKLNAGPGDSAEGATAPNPASNAPERDGAETDENR